MASIPLMAASTVAAPRRAVWAVAAAPCAPAPVVTLGTRHGLPVTLVPRATFDVMFTVTFGCATDSERGRGHEDYRYLAVVNHAALDGNPDTHPEDDVCPHDALDTPGHVDPLDGTIVDLGCGGRKPGGVFGADVKTDLVTAP